MKFRPSEIQFLRSNLNFTHRKLEIGECPKCGKKLARLLEKRIVDNKIFDFTYTKSAALKIIKECSTDIEYTSLDLPKQTGVLKGFRYGENKEKVNAKTGEVTITQKACDFYGNKETVKKFKI